MAKKTKKKKAAPKKAAKPAKKIVKKAPKKAPRPASRRVALGLPSKAPKTVEAAEGDSKDQTQPPAETSKPAAAGGTVTEKDGGGFIVTVTREFTKEECDAVLNVGGGESGDNDDIGEVLLDFCHKHIDDAVAEAEADTASEQPRYSAADAPTKKD